MLQKHLKRYEQLKGERQTTDSFWQEVADYCFPYRDFNTERSPGENRSKRLYDSTALHSGFMLASALHGHLTPMGSKWFSIVSSAGQTGSSASAYLEFATNKMLAFFASPDSQFALAAHQMYLDLVFFGMGVMRVTSREGQKVFSTIALRDFWIDEDHTGSVCKGYYSRKYNPETMISEFGSESVHPKVKEAYEKGQDVSLEVLNVVEPRMENSGRGAVAKEKRYASYYYDVTNKHTIKETGYDDFPYMVPRFTKRSNEKYGFSPAMQSLSDARMLNQIAEVMLRAATKNADPTMLSPVEGVVMPYRLDPGGIVYYNPDVPKPEFWNNGFRPDYMDNLVMRKREDIQKAFFVDWLNLPELSRMTTVEIARRSQDSMRNMSAMNARMEAEFLSKVIRRLFYMMIEDGDLPVPPPELQGRDVKIEYQSPIAQAQKSVNANAVLQGLSTVAQLAQFDPNVAMVINAEAIARDQMTNTYFMPFSYLRSPEEVEDMVEARNAQAASQQAAENMQGYSQAAKNTADAVTTLGGI